MNQPALSGEYLPAGESDVVGEGREAWGRIKDGVRMMRDDWLLVGRALSKGKAENPSTQAFGRWCDENGFGDIGRGIRADSIWLVEHHADVKSFDIEPTHNNPVSIRAAYRKASRPPAQESTKTKKPKESLTSRGRIVSAIQDLSNCGFSGESLYQGATDKQRALLRQEIRRALSLLTKLSEVISNEPV